MSKYEDEMALDEFFKQETAQFFVYVRYSEIMPKIGQRISIMHWESSDFVNKKQIYSLPEDEDYSTPENYHPMDLWKPAQKIKE